MAEIHSFGEINADGSVVPGSQSGAFNVTKNGNVFTITFRNPVIVILATARTEQNFDPGVVAIVERLSATQFWVEVVVADNAFPVTNRGFWLMAVQSSLTSHGQEKSMDTRLEAIRRILDAAVGSRNPRHQGKGRFWNLPRDEFVAATIYGQQVIVPGDPASSALIKALRGLAPFDGSRFPRMPTGGPYVNDADIAFIEQWIRDGAPANNQPMG